MAPINLKSSSKGVTVLIIAAVLLFLGCTFAYVAASGKLKNAAKELEAKTKQVNESEQMAQKLEKSKLEFMDARSQLHYLETSVSTQAYVPTFLKQLEYLGKSTNLKVIGVKPEEVKKTPVAQTSSSSSSSSGASASTEGQAASGTAASEEKPYDELIVEVEAEGNYMNVLDFIYKLTSFPKIVLMNNVEVSPASQTVTSGSPDLNVKMNITAFVFKAEKSGAKPKTQVSSTGRSGNDAG